MKYYIAALSLCFFTSCKDLNKNYRTVRDANEPLQEEVQTMGETASNPSSQPENADAEPVEQTNSPTADSELVAIAGAVKSKLIIDLTNTLEVMKKNSQLQGLNLDIDTNQLGNAVEQIILKQGSVAALQTNQQQIQVEIENLIKKQVKDKIGNNAALVDAVFDEVSKQISSQIIKSFQ